MINNQGASSVGVSSSSSSLRTSGLAPGNLKPNTQSSTVITHQGMTGRFHWKFQEDGKFVCLYPGCGCSYTRYQRLKGHFKQRHLNKGQIAVYQCPYCPKTSVEKSNLKVHMRLHTGEKPFKCQYCDKRFSSLGNKNDHERRHSQDKPYTCYACDRGFYRRYLRDNHLKMCPCILSKNAASDALEFDHNFDAEMIGLPESNYNIQNENVNFANDGSNSGSIQPYIPCQQFSSIGNMRSEAIQFSQPKFQMPQNQLQTYQPSGFQQSQLYQQGSQTVIPNIVAVVDTPQIPHQSQALNIINYWAPSQNALNQSHECEKTIATAQVPQIVINQNSFLLGNQQPMTQRVSESHQLPVGWVISSPHNNTVQKENFCLQNQGCNLQIQRQSGNSSSKNSESVLQYTSMNKQAFGDTLVANKAQGCPPINTESAQSASNLNCMKPIRSFVQLQMPQVNYSQPQFTTTYVSLNSQPMLPIQVASSTASRPQRVEELNIEDYGCDGDKTECMFDSTQLLNSRQAQFYSGSQEKIVPSIHTRIRQISNPKFEYRQMNKSKEESKTPQENATIQHSQHRLNSDYLELQTQQKDQRIYNQSVSACTSYMQSGYPTNQTDPIVSDSQINQDFKIKCRLSKAAQISEQLSEEDLTQIHTKTDTAAFSSGRKTLHDTRVSSAISVFSNQSISKVEIGKQSLSSAQIGSFNDHHSNLINEAVLPSAAVPISQQNQSSKLAVSQRNEASNQHHLKDIVFLKLINKCTYDMDMDNREPEYRLN